LLLAPAPLVTVHAFKDLDFCHLKLILGLSYLLLLKFVLTETFIEFVDQLVDLLDPHLALKLKWLLRRQRLHVSLGPFVLVDLI